MQMQVESEKLVPLNHLWLTDNLSLSIIQKCREGRKLEIIAPLPPVPLPAHRSRASEKYEVRSSRQQASVFCLLIKSARR